MAQVEMQQELEQPPAYSDPLLALIIASGCVTTLLFVLTEHFAGASAAMVAYVVAWLVLHRG
jgi:hypothetical protein